MARNEDRAKWAAKAVSAYVAVTRYGGVGQSMESGQEEREVAAEWISDLIGDLGHLASLHDLNMGDLVTRGLEHYHYEVENPDEG